MTRLLSAPPASILDLSLYVMTFSYSALNLMASGTKILYSHIFEV